MNWVIVLVSKHLSMEYRSPKRPVNSSGTLHSVGMAQTSPEYPVTHHTTILTEVKALETLHNTLVGVLLIQLGIAVGQHWHAATESTKVASVSIAHPSDAAGTGVERDDRVINVVVAKLGIGHDDVVAGVATNAQLAMTEMIQMDLGWPRLGPTGASNQEEKR
jgi:hypothetical protein